MDLFAERDWKYLRSIRDEMLNELCARVNEQSARILEASGASEHAKYRKLQQHVRASREIVALCFDDWSRSTIYFRALALKSEGLLTADRIARLSPDAQECLRGPN